MTPTVLFYCQHSVGIGHLTRSFALAASMAGRFKVVFLNGGPLPPLVRVPAGVQIIDLPPLGMVDGHELVSRGDGMDVPQARRLRREWILQALQAVQPDILFIELFPFGRKKFAFELLPLLKAAKAMAQRRDGAPRIVSSLRDILVAARPDQQHHDDRAAWICQRWFDAVLVHADPRLARLEETFRPRRPLRTPVFYTGFVVPERNRDAARPRPPATRSILVSAGGGIVGGPLLNTALEAHARLPRETRPRLDLVTGPFLPEADWVALQAAVAGRDDVILQRVVPDLAARMRAASVSLSQCGYNTAMDIVMAGVPALVVPYAEGREDEQTNRARRMAELGLLRWIEALRLTPSALAAELQQTLEFTPRPNGLDVDGAARTVDLLASLVATSEPAAPLQRIA